MLSMLPKDNELQHQNKKLQFRKRPGLAGLTRMIEERD